MGAFLPWVTYLNNGMAGRMCIPGVVVIPGAAVILGVVTRFQRQPGLGMTGLMMGGSAPCRRSRNSI
jgi:hypothetical protein